jgi:hypothetical protein
MIVFRGQKYAMENRKSRPTGAGSWQAAGGFHTPIEDQCANSRKDRRYKSCGHTMDAMAFSNQQGT